MMCIIYVYKILCIHMYSWYGSAKRGKSMFRR